MSDEVQVTAEVEEEPPQAPPPRGRVVMLVTNPCVNDSRVIRAAEAVAAEGFEVTVLATAAPELPDVETRNGVHYRRLALASLTAEPGAAAQPVRVPPRPGSLIRHPTRSSLRTLLRPAHTVADRGLALLPDAWIAPGRRALRDLRQRWRDYRRKRKERRKKRKAARAGRPRGIARLTARLPKPKLPTIAGTRRAEALFGEVLGELSPDIIHAHDFVTLPVGAKAAARLKALCIYDAHELEMHRNVKRGRLDRWLAERLERRYIRVADAVVTVCDSIADHLADAYRIPRPDVVMNAPDAANLEPIGRDVRLDLGLSPDTPLAIYVGRITIGRGIETLARALPRLPEMHLALLGPVHPPTVEAATEVARTNGTDNRFHVLPPVPPSAILPYVASADVSVVPIQNVCLSYFYCLPNKLIESTLAGLPVVVSDFPEMRRYVELGECGVTMDVTDPADVARAMSEAYRRRTELRLDAARRDLIEATYGWEAQRQTLVSLYDRLWQKRRAAAPPVAA